MPRRSARLRQLLIAATALAGAAVMLPAAAQAGFADGVKAYEAGDYKAAFDEWLPLAEGGDVAAMRNIGHLYRWGQGVDRDMDKAIEWYRRAAETGFVRAQSNLAAIYMQGDGVPVDYAEARKWFEAAAHQGSAVAQYNLGLMYELGLGVEPNSPIALGWYNLAAKQGQTDALNRLSLLVMTPDKAARDSVLTRGPDQTPADAVAKITAPASTTAPDATETVAAPKTGAAPAPQPAPQPSATAASPPPPDTPVFTTSAATALAVTEPEAARPVAPPAPPAEPVKPEPERRGLFGRLYSAIVSGGGASLPDLIHAAPSGSDDDRIELEKAGPDKSAPGDGGKPPEDRQ